MNELERFKAEVERERQEKLDRERAAEEEQLKRIRDIKEYYERWKFFQSLPEKTKDRVIYALVDYPAIDYSNILLGEPQWRPFHPLNPSHTEQILALLGLVRAPKNDTELLRLYTEWLIGCLKRGGKITDDCTYGEFIKKWRRQGYERGGKRAYVSGLTISEHNWGRYQPSYNSLENWIGDLRFAWQVWNKPLRDSYKIMNSNYLIALKDFTVGIPLDHRIIVPRGKKVTVESEKIANSEIFSFDYAEPFPAKVILYSDVEETMKYWLKLGYQP